MCGNTFPSILLNIILAVLASEVRQEIEVGGIRIGGEPFVMI
jgi:hypothetical protein